MKILRFLAFALGGLAALAALLAVAVWVLLSSLDASAIKTQLSQQVRDRTQRELKIEGDLALSLWPALGVRAGAVSLSERGSEARFARLDSAQVSLALWPLLKKEFVVESLRVEGLSATVVRNKKGELNIADLIAADPQAGPLRFDIAAVDVERADLQWVDELEGATLRLSQARLQTGRIARQAEGRLVFGGQLDDGHHAATLALEGAYRVDRDRQRFAVEAGQIKVSGLRGAWSQAALTLGVKALNFDGATQQGAIEMVQLQGRGNLAGRVLEADFTAPKVALAGGQAQSENMSLTLQHGATEAGLAAKFNLQGAKADQHGLTLAGVTLDATFKSGTTAARSHLSGAVKADWASREVQVSAVSGQLDVTDPAALAKPVRVGLSGQARLNLARPLAWAALQARVDETLARIELSLPGLSPRSVEFDVDVDQLNVDKYRPVKAVAAKAEGEPSPLDFSALAAFDGRGRVRIGSLQLARVKLREVRAQLKGAGGVVEIAPFSAQGYEGMVSGSARIRGEALAASQTLTNVALGPFMKDAFGQDVLQGRLTLSLDASASGQSVAALKRSLTGKGRLEVRDGAIKGVNLARTLRDLKASVQSSSVALGRTEKTDFSEASGTFVIERGVLRNQDLVLKAPWLRGSGAGQIDLGGDRIDYLARLGVVAAATGQGGKEWAELKGLTLPLRITGALGSPRLSLDPAEMARENAKAKIEEAKARAQQKVQEKMEEKLRGLLRR